ncbi:MAG TPA: Fur family transcriptional regulator [Stellaceae bacterium]|nr:Fur family transcriptional regulator [Stellaceae bacterium]
MSADRRTVIAAQLEAAAGVCEREGARLTELRRRVLGLILEAEGPVTAYQLLDRLKETRKRAAPPTIYRALDFLISRRLIHKLERLNAFVPCIETGHEHAAQFLICRQCGTVIEIEDHAAADALEHAAEREGFHPRRAIVEIEGTCALCFHP